MFKFCNLYSGSSGNCSFIKTENTQILVDCGVSSKKIEEALSNIGESVDNINAIIISHEHSDHVKGLAAICKKQNIPIYANTKTFEKINQNIATENKRSFNSNEKFEIGDITVEPFSIPHDAADPCGFNLLSNNEKVSIATDIGHMESKILHKLEGSNLLLLESNYEPDMLKSSKYPYMLKKRILGPYGHLSNEDASTTIYELIKSGSNNIMLGHLSEHNNFPELAYQTVMTNLISKNIDIDNLKLEVAYRDKPNSVIDLK